MYAPATRRGTAIAWSLVALCTAASLSACKLPNGFFLKTERSQVLFVEHDRPSVVNSGDTVRVVGPLALAATAVFDGWKADALEGEIEAEWKILPLWYLKAAQVQI